LAEFRGVCKTFTHPVFKKRTIQALNGISLAIQPGEVFGLLGPNRAGKTTLVKILLGLCRATSGEVSRLGRPVSDKRTLTHVGYVHENHAFPRYLTAAGLLEFYGALTLVGQEVLRERIPQLLERVGLADRSREPIGRFSKGMLQRLGMAQALLNTPKLLVLDEPTEGLDLSGRVLLREIVDEVRGRAGSVLLVSHVLPEVEKLCDRVGVLVGGRLAHASSVEDLLRSTSKTRSFEEALAKIYRRAQA
jgi:ABC-2 type transport system ATP-binding protein